MDQRVVSGLISGDIRGSSYAFEVPMGEIHAVEISHPLRTVNKLQDSSTPAHRREKLSCTNSMR